MFAAPYGSGHLVAINCPLEETAMWTLLVIAAAASITFALIAVGVTIWRDWRPFTEKERARTDG
jgi:hypothetical protein